MLHTQDGKVEEFFFFSECCKARLDDVLCIHAAADLKKERSIAGNSIFLYIKTSVLPSTKIKVFFCL